MNLFLKKHENSSKFANPQKKHFLLSWFFIGQGSMHTSWHLFLLCTAHGYKQGILISLLWLIFPAGGVWNREILIKNGSWWTQNWKNGTSRKWWFFFIFCLYINEKCKKIEFFGCHSSFLIKNHWKIMFFGFLWLRKMQKW